MIVDFKKKPFVKSTRLFLSRPKILYPLLVVCIVALYFFLDKPFALFFLSTKSDWQDLLFLINGLMNPFLSLVLLPSLFFFVRFLQRRERKSRKLWYLCFATSISILLASFLSVTFGRATPERLLLQNEMLFRFFEWNPSFRSFPSISSCNIAALATGLALLSPKHSFKFYTIGIMLGFVPALLTICFLSDAFAGICIGMILAKAIYKVMRRELSFS